jgi:hypothetical protein
LYSFGACRLALLASSFGWVEQKIFFSSSNLGFDKKDGFGHLFLFFTGARLLLSLGSFSKHGRFKEMVFRHLFCFFLRQGFKKGRLRSSFLRL